MKEVPMMKSARAGATGFITSLCEDIGLVSNIIEALTWDSKQWKVSPGKHILALVINTLCGRVPLYRVGEFYQDHDVEGLYGPGVSSADFNHDTLGRALDALYKANAKTVFSSLTLRNLLTSREPLQFVHADTTSKVLYGQYDVDVNSFV